MRLLLVEDDDRVAGALVEGLHRQCFDVDRVGTAQLALDRLGGGTGYDAILLDLGLPDLDGLALCHRIREMSQVPLIMVTARTDIGSRLHGLHLGADDYVTKPFDLRELVARIHAVTRRSAGTGAASARGGRGGAAGSVATARGVRIDLDRREVSVAGRPVTLTRKEFNLLAMLARRPGIVFSRSHILSEVWESAWDGHQRTLEVHVASVRSKLGVPRIIETVRGVGYRFPAG